MVQLSLELDSLARSVRMNDVRSHSEVVYHPESSRIDDGAFALKFEYRGRSHVVAGAYHVTHTSSFADNSLTKTVDCVVVNRVLTYRNGQYMLLPMLHKDELALERATRKVLSDPYSNPYLTLSKARVEA